MFPPPHGVPAGESVGAIAGADETVGGSGP